MLKDVLVVGSATISNNILSGFSSSSYGYINEALPLSSNTVEILLDLNIPTFNDYDVIMANYNDSPSGGGFVLRTDRQRYGTQLLIWGTNNNSSWTTNLFQTGISLLTGKNLLKIKYNAGTLKLSNSTDDGETFTDGNTLTATFTDFVQPFRFGVSGTKFPATNMSINLANSYIKVNGNYWHSYQETKRTRIIQRHDTAANWTSVNPVLALGEMGVETNTNKFKFGDGATAWADLAYAAGEGGGGDYTLPIASSTTLGGVKVGDNLSISEDGSLVYGKEVFDQSKYTVIGSPTITSEGVASGFDVNNYLTIPLPNLAAANSWEIQGKFTTGSNLTDTNPTLEAVFGSETNNQIIYLQVTVKSSSENYKKLTFGIGNGSSWTFDITTNSLLEVNTSYYYKVIFTGAAYEVYLSTNGITYSREAFIENTSKIGYNSSYVIRIGKNRFASDDSGNWHGNIDLSKFKIIADGEVVFNGSKISAPGTTITSADGTTKYSELALGDNFTFSKTAFTMPKLSSNGTLGGNTYACTASSVEEGYPAYQAFDNNTSTKWGPSSNSVPQYLTFYSPDKLIVSNVYLDFGSTGEIYSAGLIQGSNDNSTWDTIGSFTNNSSISLNVSCTSSVGYKYIRGYFTKRLNNGYGKVVEMKITAAIYTNILDIDLTKNAATTTSLGVVQPDGTSITISETGVISGQDVKTFTGYSDTGTLVLKSINGVLQWVAEA